MALDVRLALSAESLMLSVLYGQVPDLLQSSMKYQNMLRVCCIAELVVCSAGQWIQPEV